MTERGILFSAPMVRALLDGSKTQTRRVMKRQPYPSRSCPPNVSDAVPGDLFVCPDMFPTTDKQGSVIAECERLGVYHCMGQRAFAEKHSPYGQPSDRLWVRETWYCDHFEVQKGPYLEVPDARELLVYRADGDQPYEAEQPVWRPSIHMPRWASRILLEITGVRVERLQGISEADAIAEGCSGYRPDDDPFRDVEPRDEYRELWESINGAGSWDANPWVWVVEFRRVG